MINDIWTSVKAYLYDRTSSPLLGALITGWIAWNFKILMLFFSKADYAVKAWEIDYFYSQTFFVFRFYEFEHWIFSNYIFCVFVMPVATATFYIYIFPWLSHKVFTHSYQKQIDLNNKKKEMQGTEIIDADEKAKILSMYEHAKLETRELAVKHRQEIERIERQLTMVIQEKDMLKKKNEDQLTEMEVDRRDTEIEIDKWKAEINMERREIERDKIEMERKEVNMERREMEVAKKEVGMERREMAVDKKEVGMKRREMAGPLP